MLAAEVTDIDGCYPCYTSVGVLFLYEQRAVGTLSDTSNVNNVL